MATCPVFTDKTVKNQFNKIVSQFGGEKLSEEEFAFRGVRNARSGIDALAMNVAYFLWDAYNGDFDRIQESAVYKYASTITYVLLGNTTANKAIKNFRDSIEGLTSKEYSEINSFFGKFYKVLSNISIGKNTIDIMQMQEVADSLAHIIVGQSIQSNRPIKEVAAEVLGKFAQSLRNKYISYAEKLGVKTELHLYDEFEKIETSLTKEEYNTGVEEELESVLLRMGDKYSSVIGEFKALLLSDDINPDSAEFKELHKAYKEHISDRITVNSLLKEVNSVRVALGDRLTALKLNDLYKKQIKKYKGALEKLLSGDGKLKRKLEQGDITAAYLVEVLAPMFNNLKLLESLTSFAVYKYANFSGLDYNTDTEFGIFSISSLAQELDDVNKVDTEDGQLDLGYSDEVLDYDKSSFEKGAPISKITKQFFIGLPIGNEAVNILGMKMFIDPAAAAAVVRSILRNSTGNLNDMIGRLQKFQDKYSWLSVLIDRLEKAPAQAKEAFRNNMNAVYVNQYMVFFDLKGNTSVVYRANDASAINSLYDNWVSNLEKSNIADENGYVNLEQLAKNLEVISGKVTKNWNDSVIDELHDFFNSIGIEISRDTLTSKSTDKDNQLFARKLLKELSYKIDRLKKNNNEAKALFSDFYEVYKGKVFRALASLEIRNNPSLMPLSHKVGKKTLYSYTWHSFLSVLNSKLNSDENLVNKLLEAPYRQNSPWLRLIKDKLNKREELSEYVPVINISAFTNQVVKRFGGNENEDLKVGELHESERELLITSLMLKPVVDEITGEERIIFSMPITSDKGTYYTIEAPKFSNILEVNSSGSVVVSEQAIEDLIDYAVMPEVERMNKLIQMELRGEEIPEEYRIGGHLFHLVPKLNLQKELFDKDGYIIEDENKIREIAKAVLIREIEHEVSERVRRYKTFNIKATFDNVTIESAFGKEVADAARKNEEALLKAVARYVTMQSRLGYSAIYTTFLPDIATTYKDKYFKEAISHVVEKLSNEVPNFNKDDYTQLQLMRMVSKEDLTFAITAIRNNYNKRAAMFIASGRMGENSGTVNYLVANDRKVASKMVEQLKVILGEKYADYTEKGQLKESTNAQEFITLREYIRNLYFDGQISEDLFTTVMDFFETNSGENYREDYEQDLYKALEEKGVLEEYNNLIVNPMKPVYNWLQTDDITGIKPIYVKSSAYPLLPSMKSLEINKVRALLERNGFDRLTFPSAVKLGVPPKPIELWDKDGNIREDFTPDELEPAALRVDRIGLRIQQDVPFHGLKYVINKSTQAEKNLFTDLLNIRKIVYKGKEYNGKDLHTHYLMLQEKLYGLLTDRLCKDLGVERNGNNVVTSINKEKLRDLLVEEGKKRGFSPVELAIISDLDYLSLLPLTPSASIKTEALFNALVKNRIIKIKYPGNSYVLSTEEGFQTKKTATVEEIDKDEVYYTDSFTGELDPGSYVDADGNVLTGKALEEAFKNGTAIVKRPSQVLIPWRFVINGKSVGVESFLKEENGKKMIDMSRVDPEILKMIGLRIPNAGLNSMAAIEIVGFLPEKYGDLVVASRDFLAQMGSDFDVDKLYSYGNTVFVTSDEEGNPKLVKLTEEAKDLYINELSEVRNYLTQLKKSRDSEEGPAMTSFMSLFINDLSEVNDLFKEIDIRIVQNEITDIFKTILTTPNRIIALKNLTPTSYGKFSDIAAQAAKEQVNSAIGLYSLISDEYHRRTIEKVNMGKELISIYAAFNPQLSMFQHTKFSVGTVSDESILLSLPDELLGVYEGVFTLDADNKVYLVPKLDGYITTGEMYNSLTLEAQDKLRAAVAKKIGFNKYSEQVTEYISINFEAALDLLDKEDIVFRSDILNGQLQGAVDNAKEDILGTLNINLDNVNNAIALTLLGYSEDVIGHFFRIPVVKQVFDYIKESSSALLENKDYSKSTVTAAVKTVINELIQTYGVKEITNAFEQLLKRPDVKQKSSGNRSFIHLSNLSVDTMKALINKGQNSTTNQWMDKEDLSNSLNALLQLCVINKMAQTATSVSNALRYDTKELGVSQLDLLNNIKQFYDVYANEKYPAFKETPFIQVSAARHGFYALRVLYYSFYQSKFDPIEFLGSLMNYSYWNKKGLLDYNETTLNYITNATLALVGNRLIQQYYPEFTTEDKLVSNLDVLTKLGALSGQYSVIEKAKKLKGAFPENFFLSSLISVKLTDNAYGLKIKRITHNLEKEVVNGILELYNHDEVIPEIGMSGKDFIRDVAILAMIQGDQAMFNNIFKFIMPSILEDIGVTKVLESLNGENTTLSATEKVSIANQLVQRVPKLAHSPNLYDFKNANKEEASNGYTHTAYVSGDYDLKPGRIIQHTVQQTVEKGGETKIKDVTKLFFIQDYNQDTGFLGLVEIDRIYDNKDNTLIDPALLYVGNKMIKPKPANPWYGTAAYDLSPIRGQRVYTNPLSNLDYVNKKITQLATQTSSQQEDVALESSDSSVKEVIMETPLTRVVQFLSAYTNANFELTEYLKVLSYIEEFNNTEFILNLMNQISLTRGSYQYSDRSVKIMYNRTKTALERQRVLNSILGTFTHELRHKEGHLLILVAKKYDSVNESESFLAAKAYELLQFKHQLFEGYRDVIGSLVGNRLLQQYIELMDKYFKIKNDVNSTKEQKDEVSREVNKFAEDNHINSRLWDMLYSAYSFPEFEANLMVKKEVTEIVQMLINEKYNTEETNPYLSFAENPQQAFKSLNSGIVYAYTKKYGKDLGIFSMLYMTKLGLNIIAKAEKMGIFADAPVESFDAIASSGTLNYEIYGTPTENRIPTPDEIRKQFGELTKDGKPKLLAVDTNGSSKNYLIMQQRAIRINKGQPYYDVRVVKTHGEGTLRSKEFYTLAFFPRTRVTQELVDSISQEEIEERKKFCGY